MFPVAYWLHADALSAIQASLLKGPLITEGWIEPSAIERLLVEHKQHRADHHVRIWMLLNLEAWHRIYMCGEQAAKLAEPSPAEVAAL